MKLAASLALAAVLLAASLSAATPAAPVSPQAQPAVAGLLLVSPAVGGSSCNATALAFQPAPSPVVTVPICGSCSTSDCIGKSVNGSCGTSGFGFCTVIATCAPTFKCRCQN
jgi:predicted alpha/beta hydrolase family esterase